MNSEHFRLGNYVYSMNKTVSKVMRLEMDYDQVWVNVEGTNLTTSRTGIAPEPIPLDEEWLVKFGFEYLGAHFYEYGDFKISIKGKFFYFSEGEETVSLLYPEHIHQLQNLYFALTGEELTIKNN